MDFGGGPFGAHEVVWMILLDYIWLFVVIYLLCHITVDMIILAYYMILSYMIISEFHHIICDARSKNHQQDHIFK